MFPVEAVCMEVLQKGMAEIGGLWYEDRASVQQEHFASGLAMRRLDALLSASPAPSRNHTVLVGCPPNEWHTFTPLLLSLLLRRRGLNVIYLGANVPADRFKETVTVVHANLVILVAQTLTSAATLQLTALSLTGLRIPVGFGGRIFNLQPNLVEHIPGHYLGDAIDSSLEEVERLLKGKLKAYHTQDRIAGIPGRTPGLYIQTHAHRKYHQRIDSASFDKSRRLEHRHSISRR